MERSKMMVVAGLAAAVAIGVGFAVPLPGRMAQAALLAPKAAAPADSAQNIIRIDGERSELRFETKDAGLKADNKGASLRTPFGKLELQW